MNTTPDGDYQTYKAESGAYIREHFFGRDPRTRKMVEHLSDDEIWNLKRGGHDYRKLYAAYKAAMEHTGQPTVILAKTIKGWTLGSHFEGRNATHQMKKQIAEVGVPEVPEFLEQIVASGGHLWACRMSADMMHLAKDDLYEGVEDIINAADFIEKTDGAQLLFI